MTHLTINLLGTPEIRHNDSVRDFATRKAVALLAYLATEAGAHSREKLTALLWPESDSKRGRAAFRRTLAYLREGLGEDHHLDIDNEALRFIHSPAVALDLATLNAVLTESRTWLPTAGQALNGSLNDLIERLQTGLQQYRGDFLSGFTLPDAAPFDDWASTQREFWHQRADQLYARLAQLQSEIGARPAAIATTRRWLTHNQLNEAAHRQLMQLHLTNSDPAAALVAYEACRAVLARELNAQPAPLTEALVARARGHHKLTKSNTASHHPLTLSPPHLATLSSSTLPFVGRTQEHSQLVATYYVVSRGKPQVVALEGEAGIGKTRLATELLAWAMAQGADVVQSRAFENSSRIPYQVLVDALRPRLEAENAPEDLVSDIWLAELSRLFPELRERYPDLAPPSDDQAAQTRLFEAVTRLFKALTVAKPLLFFLDDAQWIDAASLDFLRHALHQWSQTSTPLLLLLTIRNETLAAESGLPAWFATLLRQAQLVRLPLPPISALETRQLVQAIAIDSADMATLQMVSDWLLAQSNGLPFFLIELLKTLGDGADTTQLDLAALRQRLAHQPPPLSATLREVVAARLARLSADALNLLTAAGIMGCNFGFEALCAIAGLDENNGVTALEELLTHRLLTEQPAADSSYRLSHDIIREVILGQLSTVRRRLLHRRAFTALAQDTRPAPTQLAYHALAAGLDEAAFRYSLVAGDEALQLFAVHNAIAHFEQALALHTATPTPPSEPQPAQVAHLFTQLGRAHELNDNLTAAQRVYAALLAYAEENQQPVIACAALNRLATMALQADFDLAQAETYLQRAKTVALALADAQGQAETAWNLAQTALFAKHPDRAIAYAQEALTLAQQVSARELIARSINMLAFAELAAGQWSAALEHAEQAQAAYKALGNRALTADSLGLLALAQLRLGQTRAAITTARAALTMAQAVGNAWSQAQAKYMLAQCLVEAGELDEALTLAQQAIGHLQTTTFAPLLINTYSYLGTVLRHQHDLAAALTNHQQAWTLCEHYHVFNFQEDVAAELCADYAALGDWGQAGLWAQRAQTLRNDSWLYNGLVRDVEIVALRQHGEVTLAAHELARFAQQIGDNPRYLPIYRRALTQLQT